MQHEQYLIIKQFIISEKIIFIAIQNNTTLNYRKEFEILKLSSFFCNTPPFTIFMVILDEMFFFVIKLSTLYEQRHKSLTLILQCLNIPAIKSEAIINIRRCHRTENTTYSM